MGKKKHKKKQKKAEQAEKAAAAAPSSLHRVGQALLDQARSPMGRQLIASGLVVAAAALARETTRSTPDDTASAEPQDGPPREPAPKAPGASDAAAFAGLALSALDHFIRRKSPDDKA
ncbi:hypothetical protein [Sphingomonas sp. Leaf21]|jgi:hypothetical protein|uniref:hypothetical protein n=1 Tax=Sphingomonas sp. Leaf21 TaxID=2876550 RepID=UPI001E42A1F0|nr:hypothetical protein [Sphingomonas sp. Leaf21]